MRQANGRNRVSERLDWNVKTSDNVLSRFCKIQFAERLEHFAGKCKKFRRKDLKRPHSIPLDSKFLHELVEGRPADSQLFCRLAEVVPVS
jgi:hypothetical protein